ncbi:hypothetical protein ACS0TY_009406 [Phlomoides rotata]
MIKYTLLLSLIISSFFLQTRAACIITKKYTVHIANLLGSNSPPLSVHCRSKDDDLGSHILSIGDDYNWSFCVNPFSTHFSCNFQWNSKDATFDIFKAPWHGKCYPPVCFYGVKVDGFYFSHSYPPGSLDKVLDW